MNEPYLALKKEIRELLYTCVQSNSFEESVNLYYDTLEISIEDGLEVAFDTIYKWSEENDIYVEETFIENVEETFYRYGNTTNIDSLKKRIANNHEKPAVNDYFQEMIDQALQLERYN